MVVGVLVRVGVGVSVEMRVGTTAPASTGVTFSIGAHADTMPITTIARRGKIIDLRHKPLFDNKIRCS